MTLNKVKLVKFSQNSMFNNTLVFIHVKSLLKVEEL